MDQFSIKLLKKYWFDELGCSEADLIPGKTLVVEHGSLKGYSGIKFAKLGDTCIVSAPEVLLTSLRQALFNLDCAHTFNQKVIAETLGGKLDRMIGPAWIGQIDISSFRPCHGTETRMLSGDDWPHLEMLLASCTDEESDHSSLEAGRSPTVGVFKDGILVAAAGYEVLFEIVAHIGVLTHPKYRGQGMAKKVISAITEVALAANLGIQFQTLCSNIPSVRSAESLGFRKFAETIAARVHL